VSEQTPLFQDFTAHTVKVGPIDINCRVGGEGPPLLLLHGCPQTHVMWHKLAPELAKKFTVVAADLRGYGDSSKPAGLKDHSNYSFREMALDQVAVMSLFGFDRFSAIGHDRGARVLHRIPMEAATRPVNIVLARTTLNHTTSIAGNGVKISPSLSSPARPSIGLLKTT
jgi:haloacetate dehalogenase